ncbi:MAG: DUF4215 domain-containing protein, partial [bacterium]|nr:DUF4215 domain-containing protein [bacterium]
MRQTTFFGVIVIAVLLSSAGAKADVLFSNLEPDGSHELWYGTTITAWWDPDKSDRRIAHFFDVAGGSYTLDSVSLILVKSSATTAPNGSVRIYLADDNGNKPGNTIEVLTPGRTWPIWSPTGPPGFAPTTTLASTGHPILSQGERYWIVAEPTTRKPSSGLLYYEWLRNADSDPGQIAIGTAWGDGLSWPNWDGSLWGTTLGAYQVDGTPVPPPPVCGDGMIEAPETCDDGNSVAGDGCDANCQIESGWTCSGEPSACSSVCGDGFIRDAETCDDGGTS